MAGLETAIDLLTNVNFNTSMFNQTWLIYLTIITATMLIITRKWSDWGTLFLPVIMGWQYFGAQIPTIFFVVGSIWFVIDIMSLKVLTGAFEGMTSMLTSRGRAEIKIRRAKYLDRRHEIREELEKLKDFRKLEPERLKSLSIQGDLERLKSRSPDEYIAFEERKKLKEEKIRREILDKEFPDLIRKRKMQSTGIKSTKVKENYYEG